MVTYIGSISESVPVIHPETRSEVADQLFKNNPALEGIIVANNKIPLGLLMKSHFYEKIGSRYGYDLYMGRPVKLVMNRFPLIVDYYSVLTEVSTKAMKREHHHLYDYVIVTQKEEIIGIVTIQNLLLKFAEIQAKSAMYTNPLTGLPGNKIIDDKVHQSLDSSEYSILYIDLDNFKTYNDTYGFKMGDELIQATANIIASHIKVNSFLGHIGGDDFLAILYNYDFEIICKAIIHDFDKIIKNFYHVSDLKQGYVIAKNRKGKLEQFPLVSISIAVITNRQHLFSSIEEIGEIAANLKKECKLNEFSCYQTFTPKVHTS